MECVSAKWAEAGVDNGTLPTRGSTAEERRAVEHLVSAVEECRPVANWNTVRGSQYVMNGDACEGDRRKLITQETRDSEMNYERGAREIDIPMASLSTGAREGYRRSFQQWASFCRGQDVSVWLDSADERWGENLMNFTISEPDVVGLKASAIRSKVSGYAFPMSPLGRMT